MQTQWKNEADVDDYVKKSFQSLNLQKTKTFLKKQGVNILKKLFLAIQKQKIKAARAFQILS